MEELQKRRWVVTFCLATLACLALFAFRVPLLVGHARLLSADQPPRRGDAVALFLSELESAAAFEEAAELYRLGWTTEILLIPQSPDRLERLGVFPRAEQEVVSRLKTLGVPSVAIHPLGETLQLVSPDLRPLKKWLLEDKQRTVTCLVAPFSSRRHVVVTNSRLHEERQRVHWVSMSDDRFDATNWWQSRQGVLMIFCETIRLAHVFLYGPGDAAEQEPPSFVTWGALGAAICLSVVAFRQTRWRRWLAGAASPIFLFVAFHAVVLPYAADFLDISTVPGVSDYVLVLNGRPNTRPFVAAEIVRSGSASQVLLTTASPTPATVDGLQPPEHEIISRVLQVEGVDAEDICLLPEAITSTYDEAQSLARFLDANPDRSVTVVSDGFHLRRARWVFRRVLEKEDAKRLSFASAEVEGIHRGNWWKIQKGVSIYLSEYLKLPYYWFSYS